MAVAEAEELAAMVRGVKAGGQAAQSRQDGV